MSVIKRDEYVAEQANVEAKDSSENYGTEPVENEELTANQPEIIVVPETQQITGEIGVKPKSKKGKVALGIFLIVCMIMAVISIFGDSDNSPYKQLCSFVKENGVYSEERDCYIMVREVADSGSYYIIAYAPEGDIITLGKHTPPVSSMNLAIYEVAEAYASSYQLSLNGNKQCDATAIITASEFSETYSIDGKMDVKFNYIDTLVMADVYRNLMAMYIDEILTQTNYMIAESGITMKDFGFVNY